MARKSTHKKRTTRGAKKNETEVEPEKVEAQLEVDQSSQDSQSSLATEPGPSASQVPSVEDDDETKNISFSRGVRTTGLYIDPFSSTRKKCVVPPSKVTKTKQLMKILQTTSS